MVEARTNKLSEWSVSLHKYEEVYVGTVRSYDDLAHEVSKLEESVLEGMSDERLFYYAECFSTTQNVIANSSKMIILV
jgi:hypothetical protein